MAQEPNVEPASMLLERIKAEQHAKQPRKSKKITKGKKAGNAVREKVTKA